MNKPLLKTKKKAEEHYHLLKDGNELGLTYFYICYYAHYAYRAMRMVKEDLVANSIAQEAFLRLWVMRDILQDVNHIHQFLGQQVREAATAYYGKTIYRFHRSMLRLDGIDDFQDFMLGYEMEEAFEEDTVYLEQLEEKKKQQLTQVNELIPQLNQQQQLFIRLCLKYEFNYERIAYHLGGISDYEVGQRIENCIANIKAALSDSRKLETAMRTKPMIAEGMLSDEQAQILMLRYDLQYSFEEIAESLHLDDSKVKSLFVQAHAVIKKGKKSA
ncbi:sigma factor-like helix-turn-helix DNA-binding protein [Olivibacter sp. XZL3]|uniref:sigma factor-like helix-turn-helix DNA-binding protein n=1 Tax=Olivibacter sp. XZL3 TaxID=1735116 RepID=UPI0010662094|nr:sigma factor-like helix-turn-helix DNA-binding protein [Olivibacter sp. XZL3]